MLKTLRNAWKIEELRKKILFTLFMILIYRLGNAVPVPYVNVAALGEYFTRYQNTVLGLYNVMSGSSFSQATIFALSIQPYINASIIIQLLTIAIPALERLSKEGGEEGKKKIERITRYTTVALALLQGFAYYTLIRTNGLLVDGTNFWNGVVIIATFVAGSSIIMWMGEQITEFGVGNGISVILFVGIVSRLPNAIISAVGTTIAAGTGWWKNALIYFGVLVGAIAMIVLIVIVTEAERRIAVQYSKRVVGRKVYGGQSTHLPMKVNMSGVLPVIFAQSIASLPATIFAFAGVTSSTQSFWGGVYRALDTNTVLYMVLYFLLIIFFSYFYSTIQFNPVEVSNNLRKNGGYIPGFRPGKPTSDFIAKVLRKITLFGAVYLGIVAIVPLIVNAVSATARSSGIAVGGTSLIILVGVALETVKSIEAQMVMRNYKGFLE
ncbi:MAG: preprotein translocase subunit SecY [Oscillospiraceae bacterium]|nr:preprotein translocase subunit SecY [Oscillospiraceae bacterium]MBQ1768295.1 preprotein translocase subunit SecY [Oscillospiraceae bacterium]MBQ3952280.1 preprotein translocase subunit SecY [Oscillospiraceae bacterium]MBQ3985581.1 preprotein translocase subunit SecY [Oscillospiraceae bacterium]MBQ5514276.1 preprotein translocase subunit SecY [Oscillospiraceae bacterium]